MNSASLCSLTGRYDNPIPTPCLAPIDCLKIPAQAKSIFLSVRVCGSGGGGTGDAIETLSGILTAGGLKKLKYKATDKEYPIFSWLLYEPGKFFTAC
jgi:hypothetical protein